MSDYIPFANPHAQYMRYQKAIQAAMQQVLNEGCYVLGNQVRQFEEEFSSYIGTRHCIGVGSGTDALSLSLRSLNISPGDEVITVSHTAVATVAAIAMTGATPVLIDIEKDRKTLNPELLENAISKKTKAIIVVHIYGQPAQINDILSIAERHGLTVIEDCAQATGALYDNVRVGSIAHIGCFSFYPTKNLGAIGDGGAITTNDSDLAKRLRSLRQYGWNDERESQEISLVSRLDELQASILRVKLEQLDSDNQKRQNIADHYQKSLSNLPLELPLIEQNSKSVFHLYVIQHSDRDLIKRHLNDLGVGTAIHYPKPVHHHQAFQQICKIPDKLKITEEISHSILSLPMFPEMSDTQKERVTDALKRYFSS